MKESDLRQIIREEIMNEIGAVKKSRFRNLEGKCVDFIEKGIKGEYIIQFDDNTRFHFDMGSAHINMPGSRGQPEWPAEH